MRQAYTITIFIVLLVLMIVNQSSAQAIKCRSTQTIQMQAKEIVLKLLEQQANEIKPIKLVVG